MLGVAMTLLLRTVAGSAAFCPAGAAPSVVAPSKALDCFRFLRCGVAPRSGSRSL
jgi:hypothetical protein